MNKNSLLCNFCSIQGNINHFCSLNVTGNLDLWQVFTVHRKNHKSLSGKCIILVLQCFTAIVGPNGSGKSNVIDSMLFVFGYRASKIRSKKISVLIHNSAQHQNIQSCTVAVHFQQITDIVRLFLDLFVYLFVH